MTALKLLRRDLLRAPALLGLAAALPASAQESWDAPASSGGLRAPRPPMGWNSWNSFATTLTEAQAIETARIMADKLLPSGYDVFTVDIQWYEPNATGYDYRPGAALAMDGHGRLLPAYRIIFGRCPPSLRNTCPARRSTARAVKCNVKPSSTGCVG